VENEKCTLSELEYGDKTGKRKKIRNSHDRTWNIVGNTEKVGK
jgi:hypothetical protein